MRRGALQAEQPRIFDAQGLASVKAPERRIPAAALGAILGPLIATGLLVGSSPFNAPIPTMTWVSFLPAAALAAVYFTRPLRINETSLSSVR